MAFTFPNYTFVDAMIMLYVYVLCISAQTNVLDSNEPSKVSIVLYS